MKQELSRKLEGEEEELNSPPGKNQSDFKNEKMRFGFSFSAADGEAGNQSEDNNDLPKLLKSTGHQYDPNLSEQNPEETKETNEITSAMHIADKNSVGLSFSDKDSYTDLSSE